MHLQDEDLPREILSRDNDAKYTKSFDHVFGSTELSCAKFAANPEMRQSSFSTGSLAVQIRNRFVALLFSNVAGGCLLEIGSGSYFLMLRV